MPRGIQRFESYGAFSRHKTGGGGKFFRKWKDKGYAEVWFHMRYLPMATWRHPVPQLVPMEDRDDKSVKVMHVWSKQLVCHEETSILEGQYFRDRDTGERKHPPERSGICKLIEWAHQQASLYEATRGKKVRKGINFTTPMFKFEGDVDKERRILRVGGICNMFGSKHLSPEQKKEMKEAGIKMSGDDGAWGDNMHAKLNYAMYIVNDADIESGVQIAVEAGSLGQAIKDELEKEYENGVDPMKTPICMKWRYSKDEPDLNKKYVAIVLRNKKPSPRLLMMLKGDVPEMPEDVTTPYNQQSIRMTLEKHCVLPKGTVPWDDLFPTREQEKKWKAEDETNAAKEEANGKGGGDEDEGDGDDPDAGDEEEFECDECKKPVKASDEKCPHCGHVFEVDAEDDDDEDDSDDDDDEEEDDAEEGDEDEKEEAPPEPKKKTAKKEPEPEPKKMRSRSEASAANTGTGGSRKPAGANPKGKADDGAFGFFDGQGEDDDIPFARDMTLVRTVRV